MSQHLLPPVPKKPVRSISSSNGKKPAKPQKSTSTSILNNKARLTNNPFLFDIGLLKSSKSQPILKDPNSLSCSYMKICMADFLGEHNSSIIEHTQKLFPLKIKAKKKIFIEDIKEKRDLRRPTTPYNMDRNLKLRMMMEQRNKSNESLKAGKSGSFDLTYKNFL